MQWRRFYDLVIKNKENNIEVNIERNIKINLYKKIVIILKYKGFLEKKKLIMLVL